MITIIITAYNVNDTISKAITSCLTLTYNDLEILVINDCSTDNTVEAVKSFKDKRVRLINNSENLGPGMSRRIGTKEAKGEYTIFLDGDDYLDSNCVETLYKYALKYSSDIVSQGIKVIVDDKVVNTLTYKDDVQVLNGLESVDDPQTIKRYLNNKLIKTSLWSKVEYCPRRFIEDTLTCYYLLFFANKVVNIKYSGYNYVQNNNGLCHTADEAKFAIYRALCAKDICEFVAIHNKQDITQALEAFAFRIKELNSLILPDNIADTYKDELAELFTFFLLNITWK